MHTMFTAKAQNYECKSPDAARREMRVFRSLCDQREDPVRGYLSIAVLAPDDKKNSNYGNAL